MLVLMLCLLGAADAKTGTITGTVVDAKGVTAVRAVDRSEDKDKTYPGTIDPKTGVFTVANLPLGKTYDVVIDAGKVRVEGVNLRVPRSDFEEEQPLTKDDAKEIEKIARALNKFENEIDVMCIVGNIQHGVAVLNKRRTTAFYESKPGEMIWRLEVWRFEKPDDDWIKSQEELGTIHYRERLPKADFEKKMLTLDGAIGGVKVTDKDAKKDVGKVAIPAEKAGVFLRGLPKK